MWKKFFINEKPLLKEPLLIVALSTSLPQYVQLYSQARELAKFLLRRMEFKPFATLCTDVMPAEVLVLPDGTSRLPRTEFHYVRGMKDAILCHGDASPLDENYEFGDAILSFAESLGVKEVVSIGARFVEPPSLPEKVDVLGFASDPGGADKLRSLGVIVQRNEPSPYFSSVIVGVAKMRGIRAYKLSTNHGEPRPHPRSVMALLKVLSKFMEASIDVTELEEMTRVTPWPPMAAKEEPGSQAGREEGMYG